MSKDEKIVIKKEDKTLARLNADIYKKPVKTKQKVREYADSGKKKITRSKEYKNGVIKNEVVGVMIGTKKIFDRGIDDKEL